MKHSTSSVSKISKLFKLYYLLAYFFGKETIVPVALDISDDNCSH